MRGLKVYNIVGYVTLFLAIFSACELNNNVEGNGHVTTKRHSVTEFSKLNIDGVLNVHLEAGSTYKVEVRTDENLQGIVKVVQNGEVLEVYSETTDEYNATEMNIYITAPSVDEINLKGVTALYIDTPLRQNTLSVNKENTGYMMLKGVFQYLSINTDGVGDMDLEGKSENMMLINDMIGNFHAFDFSVNYLNMSHNGTGIVELNVITKVDIEMNGIGDVYIKGNPATINKIGNGIGRLYMVEGD